MNTTNKIFKVPLSELEVHPEIKKIHSPLNLDKIEYTMKLFGQQQPILIVVQNGKNYIIDGVLRYTAAQKIGIESLDCIVRTLTEDQVVDARIRANQKVKPSILETCQNAEHILGVLGNSQGKKRESLGFENLESEDHYGTVGKDRFELASILLNLKMSPSNLRKLMSVYWSEKELPEENKTGVLDLLEKEEVSIHKAYSLIQKKEKKEKEKALRIERDLIRQQGNITTALYNKSSLDMSEIPDSSIDVIGFSSPYLNLKDYRNQGECPYGQESSVEEYINTTRLFIREVLKKLKPNGVAFAIIGETYQGGYQGVCTRYEIGIEDEGGYIIDVNIWEKTNPRRTPHKNYFQPSHERIIVFSRPGANPVFNEQFQQSKSVEEGYKVLPSCKRKDGSKNYHMACDETPVTNVIRTGVFNKSEWEGVDPDFTHDAPAPLEIYDRFLNSYSEPGMTFLDIFSGSGQGLISGMRHGLNVIGYDIDPVSIEFCQKRIDQEFEKRNPSEYNLAA